MRLHLVCLAIVIITQSGNAVHDSILDVESYDGYVVFRAKAETKEDVTYFQSLRDVRPTYDFWTEPRIGGYVDIMVPPFSILNIETDLQAEQINYNIMIENVQSLIDLEKIPSTKESTENTKHAMTWTEYHSLEDMYTFYDYLEETYDFVTTEEIGQTYEGRTMRVAKVCKGGCGDKPAVWIDGGIHAREWISPATVTWMLRELVEGTSGSDLLDSLDFYILPSHNPDGYAFSRDDSRLWRKTRSDNGGLLHCKGVDANRNWGFHWNEGGTSNNKCDDLYHGPEAFSEVENRNVRDYILSKKDQLIFFNNVHSYSQFVLLPWGFTSTPPDDYDAMYEVAMKGSEALTAVHGTNYQVGCIPCILYVASGGSIDWAHGEVGIPFTTSMELRDTGKYGFVLPPEQIIPTAEETWAFHTTVLRELLASQA